MAQAMALTISDPGIFLPTLRGRLTAAEGVQALLGRFGDWLREGSAVQIREKAPSHAPARAVDDDEALFDALYELELAVDPHDAGRRALEAALSALAARGGFVTARGADGDLHVIAHRGGGAAPTVRASEGEELLDRALRLEGPVLGAGEAVEARCPWARDLLVVPVVSSGVLVGTVELVDPEPALAAIRRATLMAVAERLVEPLLAYADD